MKVVFDPNVLVAAFATDGLCSRLLSRANRGEFEIYISPFILQELQNNLKIKLELSQGEINRAMTLLYEIAKIVNPEKKGIKISGVCRDKDDDPILECALASDADYIVSGDRDLLTIKEYKDIKTVSPREFELLFD